MNLPLAAVLNARIPLAAVATLLLVGCDSSGSSTAAAVAQSCRPGPTFGLVDYRPEQYRWQLGQCWDSAQTQANIDAAYDWMTADGVFPAPVSVADTLPYFYIGEDLLPVEGDSVLPALYFTVNQNRLISFYSSMLFSCDPTDSAALRRAVRDFAPRFSRLRQAGFRRILLRQRQLTVVTGRCAEVYRLEPRGTAGDSMTFNEARFSYHIRLRR